MPQPSSHERLVQLFATHPVVELPTVRAALGGVSPMTAFRHLKRLDYRCSYNHKGRYYARHELARYYRLAGTRSPSGGTACLVGWTLASTGSGR